MERSKEPEVVGDFKKIMLSRSKRNTYEFTCEYDSIHKTYINSNQTKFQHWKAKWGWSPLLSNDLFAIDTYWEIHNQFSSMSKTGHFNSNQDMAYSHSWPAQNRLHVSCELFCFCCFGLLIENSFSCKFLIINPPTAPHPFKSTSTLFLI